MSRATMEIPPCNILIDREGIWYYRGAEMVRRDIVEFFYRHLRVDEQGRYVIEWQDQTCYVDVEDTAHVVWKAGTVVEDGEVRGVLLHLSDGTEEILEPETVFVGAKNVPYCRVHAGRFPARFSRKAYYQLARLIEQDGAAGGFFLRVGSRKYPIPMRGADG